MMHYDLTCRPRYFDGRRADEVRSSLKNLIVFEIIGRGSPGFDEVWQGLTAVTIVMPACPRSFDSRRGRAVEVDKNRAFADRPRSPGLTPWRCQLGQREMKNHEESTADEARWVERRALPTECQSASFGRGGVKHTPHEGGRAPLDPR